MSLDANNARDWLDATLPSRRFVRIAFGLVGVGILTITFFALRQTRGLGARAHEIVDDMLTSTRLVGQLQDHVEEKQVIIDDHILADAPSERERLEARLSAIDVRMAATLSAYDPWVNQPGERAAYERTRADLTAVREPIARALALSRENRDREARREIDAVADQFARIDKDFEQLVSINNQGAASSLAHFSTIRFRLMLALLGLGLATLAATAAVGSWASRQVARREEAMSLTARMLEARNRELDAFAGRVAHDIRGPLSSISLATTRLALTAPQEHAVTEILGRGVKRMQSLVEDLLSLARVEAHVRGRCDPSEVMAELEQDFVGRLADEQGSLRPAVAHAQVACSASLLRQTLTNLIENAIKYRRPEAPPVVAVSGSVVDGGYDLRVSDNGIGMSSDEVARAFEPFYRSPRTLHVPGTGLGLSIVNRIAQASGGRLSIETSLGHGSTFILHLSLASPPGPEPAAVESQRGV